LAITDLVGRSGREVFVRGAAWPATDRGNERMVWQVWLYTAAVLIPLAAFAVEAIFIRQLKRLNANIATGAIGLSCALSLIGLVDYDAVEAPWNASHEEGHAEAARPAAAGEHGSPAASHHQPLVWAKDFDWVLLGGQAASAKSGPPKPELAIPLGVYI